METIFIKILNMSLTASYVILLVLAARLLLRRAPRIFSYALWSIVLFRLVCPVSPESVFSLIPFKTAPIPADIALQPVPRVESGIHIADNVVSSVLPAATPAASVNPLQIWLAAGTYLWLMGIAVLLIYSIVSVVRLKRRLNQAVFIEHNIYETSDTKTAFVLGLIRPKIYIPSGLSADERSYIIRHEQTHIRRFDHAVKLGAFLVLCLHWFNPLVWLAFALMSADMEMSCDERVLKEMGGEIKKAYSTSLLSLAAGRRLIGASPLAFGEGNIKRRIKNVLNYQKPALWIVVFALIVVLTACAGLAADPQSKEPSPDSKVEKLLSYRTEYVGDNSKVGNIISRLEFPADVKYNSFELYTDAPPYAVTVNFDTDTATRNFYTGALHEGPFRKNAILMSALIQNVEYITFVLDDGVNPYSIQFTRDQADYFAGTDIWEFSASASLWAELMDKLEADESVEK